jgi:hypothetical protein
MQRLNNLKKRACKIVECFLPFITWLFENRVMRIMYELKTEELGGKGCMMRSFIIYTANQRRVTQ